MEGDTPPTPASQPPLPPPPVTISPPTPPESPSGRISRQRSPHPHEYVYCHERTCPLQQEIHCICLKECTAGSNTTSKGRRSSSLDHLHPRQHALAITYAKFQTETPYLVKDSLVSPVDPTSSSATSSDSKDSKDNQTETKKGPVYWGRRILVTLKDKVLPTLSGTAFVPHLPVIDKGKGVDRTQSSSTGAVYENSLVDAEILVDEACHGKPKEQWIEDVDAHLRQRKFSFDLPVLDGVALRDIDDFGNIKRSSDLTLAEKNGAPALPAGSFTDHEPLDMRFLEDPDRTEEPEPQDYMAERAADKAKREEMMNKLPTVHEHHDETPLSSVLATENIPPSTRLESSPSIPGPSRIPSLRLPAPRLSFSSDLHRSTIADSIDSSSNALERYHSKSIDPNTNPRLTPVIENLATIKETLQPTDSKSEKEEETEIKACDRPRRVSEWLRNVPLPQTWKKIRRIKTQGHDTYVASPSESSTGESMGLGKTRASPNKRLGSPSKIRGSPSSTMTSMNSIRQALKEWKPFQSRKEREKGESGSSDESPIRGRPRQRVERFVNVQVV